MAMAELTLPRADASGLRLALPDTLASLVAEVGDIVGDPAVADVDIVRALERGLYAVAAATRLPALASEWRLRLEPGQADAPLPADWQHGPTDAAVAGRSDRLRVLPGLSALRRAVPYGRRGRPRCVATGTGRLFARPVPEGPVSLVVGYFRLPTPLAASWDKPDCLPTHLAGPLLVAYACRELFERLEEGAGTGNKVQTAAYGRRFEAGLAELVGLFGPAVVQAEAVDIPGPVYDLELWP